MSGTYTKRASARVIKELLKYENKVSGNTTYDQAFVKLMTEWDLEGGLENKGNQTFFYVYRDGSIIHTFEWSKDEAYIEKEREWDWTFIYKTVLEHIIKTRMYKRPKLGKRAMKALEQQKLIEQDNSIENLKEPENPYKSFDLDSLKKLKNNLSSKISKGKKSGLSKEELDKLTTELELVSNEFKSRK